MRGEDVETGDRGRANHVVDVLSVDDDVVDAMAELASDDAQTAGGIALGVHIHDEPAQAELRKVGRHVDGGGRLPDSALLGGDCVDSLPFSGSEAGPVPAGLIGG